MYYARFRMYDADIRRFTATDPVRGTVLDPQTMVQYTYVLNNPLRFTDPWGLVARYTLIGRESAELLGIEPGRHPRNSDEAQAWRDMFFPPPPSSPSFSNILGEVEEWIGSMTDAELMFAISSGLFEAMGVYIPSGWLEGLGSDGHISMNDIRQDLVERLVDTIIEDSSGLGLDLLSGWEYRPGNSFHRSDDEDAVWGVVFPEIPAPNISWHQYTLDEFRELAIPREVLAVYLQYVEVRSRHGVANPDSDMIGFSHWIVPTCTTATGDLRGFGGMGRFTRYDGTYRWHMGSDFYASSGSDVVAVADGLVMRTRGPIFIPPAYADAVIIRHEGPFTVRGVELEHIYSVYQVYGGGRELFVQPGDTVRAGDIIARNGSLPLHFEVRRPSGNTPADVPDDLPSGMLNIARPIDWDYHIDPRWIFTDHTRTAFEQR